jgi:hypothetical protein
MSEKNENKSIVKIDTKGIFEFSNHLELAQAASMMIEIKEAPDHLCKAGKKAVASALMLCKQMGLHQKSMNQMAFINGKLTCYGSLVTALAERHPKYGSKKDFFIDVNCDEICVKNKNIKAEVYAAVVQIKKLGDDHWSEYIFSVDDAKNANLIHDNIKKDSAWFKYMKDMIMHKCNSRALKSNYASALEGINYHEDLVETLEQKTRDVTSTTDLINDFDSVEKEFDHSIIGKKNI